MTILLYCYHDEANTQFVEESTHGVFISKDLYTGSLSFNEGMFPEDVVNSNEAVEIMRVPTVNRSATQSAGGCDGCG